MRTKVIRTATIVVLLVVSLILPVQAGPPGQGPSPRPPGPTDETLIGQLQQETDDKTRISYHAETGKVRFIGTSPDRPIAQPAVLAVSASPEEAARGFLATYGQLFGLTDPARELTVMRSKIVDRGRSFVRFQQVYQGLPVLGGELIVQLDADQDVVSANGEVLPDLVLDTTPAIEAETARQIALAAVAKDYGLSASELRASEPELWIYNPILLAAPSPRFSALVWRTEVTPLKLAPINELVLVDAQLGAIALHFNQIDTARDRRTYDANNTTTLPGTLRCDESNPTCSGGDSHEVAAHTYAGDTYDFYSAEHGRDSIDNAGMTLISTVHYDSGYANAFWNGSQMVYGDAYGFPLADDVVAHELTHGVTDYESSLFYFYQSGAINESFSDVWGEFVDQEQATGNDAGDTRWAIGEDVSGLGALRNMQDPTLFGDPDKMTSTNYFCEQSQLGSPYGDNGGVHTNGGVGNKAAYLMVDGDSFNGYTVTGLGYAKVADLYYEVQTNLLTSAADYADLYDALIQACSNLGYSAGDCQEVEDAVDATEMNQQPTTCAATEAPICDSGSPTNLFFDDIESGSGNWTAGSNSGTIYWFVPQTTETLGLPGPYATSGVGNIWGFDQGAPIGGTSDTFLAMNSDVTLPANAYMHFNHSFGFESTWPTGSTKYDGGILEYSTNGGSLWTDAGSLITHNGYNGTLYSGNPLGAISAFSADSRGYISSRLDLSSLAGQNVRFRFRIGTDSTVYDFGWFIDDVRIYTCAGGVSDWKILFDETHGYASSGGDYTIGDRLSDLAALLTGAGATVDSLTPPATFDYATISQYDVLALVLPPSSYSSQEQADINTFVQNGGRLVVVGDWGGWSPADTARPILNAVLSSLGTGITLNADTVYDPTNYDGATSYWPIIHQFSTDPVNEGVGQVVEYAAASLDVNSPGYATAWGDDDSYATFTALSAAERDDTGLVPLSPGITASGDSIPVQAMADLGSGDVFVIGDISLWRNGDSDGDSTDNLSEYDNTQLALNVFLGAAGGGEIFLPIILKNY